MDQIPQILVTESRPQMEETVHISVVERRQPPSNDMDSDLHDNARSSFISTNSSGTSGTSEADDSSYRDSVISYSSIDSDRNSVFVADGGLLGRANSTRSMPPERLRLDSDGSEDGQTMIKDIAKKTLTRKTAVRRTHTLTPASSPKMKERRNRSISSTDSPLADLKKGKKEFFSLIFDLRFYKQTHAVEAAVGLTLREAIRPFLTDADIDIRSIDIYIESSTSPTPLEFLVHPLSGRHLYVKAKPGKASNPISSPSFAKKKMEDTESGDPSGDVLGKPIMRKDMSKFLGVEQKEFQPTSRQPNQSHEKKKDLSKLLGLNQEEPVSVKNRRVSVTVGQQSAVKDQAKEKVDPKFLKLQQTLDDFIINGLPDFPSLLTFTAKREDDHESFEIEGGWREFTNEEKINQLTKKEMDQQEAIWEIVKTEVAYIKNIRVIVDFYMCTLINLQASLILNEIETEKIFSNISAIEKLHTRFWKEKLSNVVLKARAEKKIPSAFDLSDAFDGFGDLFAPYIKFCTDENECMKYLREKTKDNEMLRFFVEWAQRHPNSRRLKLQDLLVYPMQRITKYPLLLDAVKKKTLHEQELPEVSTRYAEVKEFVERVNHELRQEQERQKMEETMGRLEAYEAVSVPNGSDELAKLVEEHSKLDLMCSMPNAPPAQARWLHMEGALKLRDADNRQEAYGFLFTDVFILAKQKKNDNFRIIKPPMRVDMLKVQELKDGSGFALVHVDEYDCAVYGCVLSTSSATQWIKKIKAAETLYTNSCNFEAEYHNTQAIIDGSGEGPTSPEAVVFSMQSTAFPFMTNSPASSPLNSPRLPQRTFLLAEMTRTRSTSSLSMPSGVWSVPEEHLEDEEDGKRGADEGQQEEASSPGGLVMSINAGSAEDLLTSVNNSSRTTFPPSKRQSLNDEGLRRTGVTSMSDETSRATATTKPKNTTVSKPTSLTIPESTLSRSLSPSSPNPSIMAFDDSSDDDDTGSTDTCTLNTSPKRKTSMQIYNTLPKKSEKLRRKTTPAKPDGVIKPKEVNGQESKSKGKSKMKYLKKFGTSSKP